MSAAPARPSSSPAFAAAERVARRAYELARVRRGMLRAAALGAALALLAALVLGRQGALPLIALFAVWSVVEWRGGAALRGARIGAPAGVLAWLVPTSAIDGCCRLGCTLTGGACCGITGACTMFGVLLGVAVGVALTRSSRSPDGARPEPLRIEAVLGGIAGLAAAAGPRCTTLVLGESVGLLLGVVAGTAVASAIGAALRPRTT